MEWEQDASEEEASGQEGASLDPSASAGAASGPGGHQSQTNATPRTSRESAAAAVPPATAAPAQQHDPDAMDVTMMEGDSDDTPPVATTNPQSAHPSTDTTTRSTPISRPGLSTNQLSTNATSSPLPIPTARTTTATSPGAAATGRYDARTPSPTSGNTAAALLNGHEGPITPRNDAGPWVFDGSGVRMRLGDATTSLNAAANGSSEMILDEIPVSQGP